MVTSTMRSRWMLARARRTADGSPVTATLIGHLPSRLGPRGS
jgi:hypothetical protein